MDSNLRATLLAASLAAAAAGGALLAANRPEATSIRRVTPAPKPAATPAEQCGEQGSFCGATGACAPIGECPP